MGVFDIKKRDGFVRCFWDILRIEFLVKERLSGKI